MIRKQINKQVACNYIVEPYRKINLLSVNFITPITKGNCTIRSMLPFILCESCNKFPSNKLLELKLYDLYDASLETVVDVIGLYQITGINISFIDNRFSYPHENIICKCMDLMTEIITAPDLINGQFNHTNVALVKKFIQNLMQAEYYEYRHLLTRYIQKIHGYNILENCYGNQKDIHLATAEILIDTYNSMLHNSRIELLSIGKNTTDIFEIFLDKLYLQKKEDKMVYIPDYLYNETTEIQQETEHISLNVSKLLIGFYITKPHNPFVLWLLTIIYGDAPFSRLFLILREKSGMCYDCSMEYDSFSRTIFFLCSMEAENKEKIQFHVINVLENIKHNGILNKELNSAKQMAKNRLLSFHQSTDTMWEWGMSQILYNHVNEPENELEYIDRINTFQIKEAASSLIVKGIYFLDNRCKSEGIE